MQTYLTIIGVIAALGAMLALVSIKSDIQVILLAVCVIGGSLLLGQVAILRQLDLVRSKLRDIEEGRAP